MVKLNPLLSIIIKLYTPILILLLLVVLVSYKTDINIGIFARDPAVIAGKNGVSSAINVNINPFVGVVSNIGILLWCICASICFFSSAILQSSKHVKSSKFIIFAAFLRYFATITLIFLLDDLFLFHETIAPKLFNISEKIIYFCYLLLLLWAIIKYRKVILKTEWELLFLAFIFFGISVLIDGFEKSIDSLNLLNGELKLLLEDGFKLFGITSWFGYFTRVCFQTLKNTLIN